MSLYLKIHPDNPQERLLAQAADIVRDGGIAIYPTDTVYAMGCDIRNKKAIERLCRLKGIDPERHQFACIGEDLKIISGYAIQISTPVYKLLRRTLPGPYTYILRAGPDIPRHFQSKKKTVGIRIVDHKITTGLVSLLGAPLLTSSVKDEEDDIRDYPTDPEEIFHKYQKLVDVMIDGGAGGLLPSTVVDLSDGEPEILREGMGPVEEVYI
jgi:tRNA threonylcarbamoyl adenosine modification protein (Sua5/YciO/YrdC/YwlC family)